MLAHGDVYMEESVRRFMNCELTKDGLTRGDECGILKLTQIRNRRWACTDRTTSFEFKNINDVYQFCGADALGVVNQ